MTVDRSSNPKGVKSAVNVWRRTLNVDSSKQHLYSGPFIKDTLYMWLFQAILQCKERISFHANVCQRISNSSPCPGKYWSQSSLDSMSNKSMKAGTQSHCWGGEKLCASSWANGWSQNFSKAQGLHSGYAIISLCDLRQLIISPQFYFFIYKKWQENLVSRGGGSQCSYLNYRSNHCN